MEIERMNMVSVSPDQEEQSQSLADYLQVFKRRRKPMRIAALITIGIAILAALFWPPSYRSSATILIEEQEIPQDLVRSTVTGFANQQIKIISQRIFTLNNIMNLVQKYGLWSEAELKRMPRTEVMSEFQKKMKLDVISADVMDPRIGRATQATIAFTLSFDHRNPAIAQKVANELVNLYMNENLKSRTEKSANTAEFLKTEADTLNTHIMEIQEKLAKFKEANEGALPELSQYNLSVVERSDAELNSSRERLTELQKRKVELQANMAQISPYAATELPTGEKALSDHDRLKALQSEFRNKSALYSPDHPDVVRLKREIAHLEETLGKGAGSKDYAKQLKMEQDKLADLKQTYTADHPEVIKQQKVVQSLLDNPDKGSSSANDFQADNPAYVLLDTQLKSTESDIKQLTARIAELQAKISKFEMNLSKAPNVEKSYADLTRELATNLSDYQQVKAKLMQAEMSKNLESESKGERYTLIEPPILPDEPASPNRIAIMLIGVILAGLTAVGTAAVLEMMDDSVRNERELASMFAFAPIGTIPYLTLAEEEAATGKSHKRLYLGIAVAVIALLLIFHIFIKPLDVLWYVVLNKLGIG